MSLFIILSRHNCHLLISNGFELLCNICYWKFLLIVFAVSLHHQTLISCCAKCYVSKLGYQLFLVQWFLNKLKTVNFQFFSYSWSLKYHTFLRMALMYFSCCHFCKINYSIYNYSVKYPLLLKYMFYLYYLCARNSWGYDKWKGHVYKIVTF